MCSNSVSCPLCCQTSFENIDSLRISLIKAANGPLACPLCTEILQGLDKLTIHLFSHSHIMSDDVPSPSQSKIKADIPPSLLIDQHDAKLPVSCSPTQMPNNFTINPTSPIGRDIFSDQIQPKCDICGLCFQTNNLLHIHNTLMHRESDASIVAAAGSTQQFHCHLCQKSFKMKGSLRLHLKVVHLLGLPVTKESCKLNICEKIRRKAIQTEKILGTDTTASCTITNPNTSSIIKIEFPIVTEVGQQLTASVISETSSFDKDLSPPENTKNLSESPKSTELTKLWDCDTCAKSFTTKYFLKKHKRLHTGEMPYSCEICGKTFTFQQSYHKHLLYHSDEKPHVCQICGRAFKELSTLHNHERIHSGEKPFKCETCGKCFRQRVSYLVHKRIHTGAMPYKCIECNKSFRYKVSQRTHKCSAQSPNIPGTDKGDLLQKLLDSSSILIDDNDNSGIHSIGDDTKNSMSDEMINKTIDDIVAESCNKMGIEPIQDDNRIFISTDNDMHINNQNDRMPSPSEKFQNLCLYSPSREAFLAPLETINEDAFKKLLYGDDFN